MNWSQVTYPTQAYRDFIGGMLTLAATPIATFPVVGSTVTFSMSFLEQVSGGVTFADTVSSFTGTREWRTSSDGTTWGAWGTLSAATVAAFTWTANNALYIEVRYTRTGGVTTGTLYGFMLRLNVDTNATSGRGSIEDTNIVSDLYALTKGIVESCVIEVGGLKAFAVVTSPNTITTGQNTPTIHLYGMQIGDEKPYFCNRMRKRVTMNWAVKAQADLYTYQDQQAGQIMAAFTARRSDILFTFAYKGQSFVDVPLSSFGITDPTAQLSGSVVDEKTNSYYSFGIITFFVTYAQNFTA